MPLVRLTDGRAFSYRAAAFNQISAIWRKLRRSLSDMAVFAQPRHSSAYFRKSFADMTRSLSRISFPLHIIHNTDMSSQLPSQKFCINLASFG